MKRCDTCDYWTAPEGGAMNLDAMGVCKRYPPSAFPVGMDSVTKRPVTMNLYPMTGAGDGCGEYSGPASDPGPR